MKYEKVFIVIIVAFKELFDEKVVIVVILVVYDLKLIILNLKDFKYIL